MSSAVVLPGRLVFSVNSRAAGAGGGNEERRRRADRETMAARECGAPRWMLLTSKVTASYPVRADHFKLNNVGGILFVPLING